jgi:hypothetical protein
MSAFRDKYAQLCANPDLFEQESENVLKIPEGSIASAMIHQAELYRVWATYSVMANDELSRFKDYIKDVVWSDCRMAARQSLEENGEKVTESRLDELANRSNLYVKQREILRDAEIRAGKFRVVEQALLQKKDMLQSLNSRQCRELSMLPSEK